MANCCTNIDYYFIAIFSAFDLYLEILHKPKCNMQLKNNEPLKEVHHFAIIVFIDFRKHLSPKNHMPTWP